MKFVEEIVTHCRLKRQKHPFRKREDYSHYHEVVSFCCHFGIFQLLTTKFIFIFYFRAKISH